MLRREHSHNFQAQYKTITYVEGDENGRHMSTGDVKVRPSLEFPRIERSESVDAMS
jgi:hypothetical protein